jgi:cytochrome c peroxidase
MDTTLGHARKAKGSPMFRLMPVAAGGLLLQLGGGVVQGQALYDLAPQHSGADIRTFPTPTGEMAILNVNGPTDRRNPFFEVLGTNGRSCESCHSADQAMSITPPKIRERFAQTRGRDPLFAPFDGANCTDARRNDPNDHSLLLEHGLIRIPLPIPANAEFTISVVHDPYGCALVTDRKTGALTVSVYRRPVPATNLRFDSSVMWDGRETVAALDQISTFKANLTKDLEHQALNATLGHAQAVVPPTPAQLAAIVNFELGLFSAQVSDRHAGSLSRSGALGGVENLYKQKFYPLINDVIGEDPTGAIFTPDSMNLFTAWRATKSAGAAVDSTEPDGSDWGGLGSKVSAQQDIAEGERLFNDAPLNITTVLGLNNKALGDNGVGPQSPGSSCTTCHDNPNVASMSRPLLMDIGVGHSHLAGTEPDAQIEQGQASLHEPRLPVFLVQGCPNPFDYTRNPHDPDYPYSHVSFYTTDPGRALVTGRCSDVNTTKIPILRGLAGRAPYFHNGSAANLLELVEFYDKRFQMNLTQRQRQQLVAFLNSL